jgi:Tol biopolymer transport system component
MNVKRIGFVFMALFTILVVAQFGYSPDLAAKGYQAQTQIFLPIVSRPNVPAIIPETTKVLSEDTTDHLVSVSDDLVNFSFDQLTPELAQLEPGDVMVSGPSPEAPYGFLRKVTSVNQVGNQILVTTQFASLEDAIEQGSFSLSESFSPNQLQSPQLPEGIRLLNTPNLEGWYFEIKDIFVDPNSCLKADGTISISKIHLDLGAEWGGFSLKEFRAIVDLDMRDDIEISMYCSEGFHREITLFHIPLGQIVVFIGPIPIVVNTSMDIVIGANGEIKAGASFSGDIGMQVRAGPVYSDGKFSFVGSFQTSVLNGTVQPVAGVELKGYFGPEVQVLLYNTGGVYVRNSVFLQLDVNLLSPEWWKLYWGVEAPIGAEINILGKETEYEAFALRYRQVLKEANGSTPTPTPGGPTPTPVSTISPTPVPTPVPGSGVTTRVSVASDGTQGNEWSADPSISADGRYVVFGSAASNLVPGDSNGHNDVFVHDRQTGQTTRVSVASDGSQGNGESYGHAVSADGRYVAFTSYATNLVPGDTNGSWDTFIHDRLTSQTTRVSVASDGTQGNSGSIWSPTISADGRYVAFASYATNLVPGDTNGQRDVFIHDRQTGETTRVSVSSNGTQGNSASWTPTISADGRYVAFESYATNLVPGDTNYKFDIFVHDRQTGQTTRVSVASDGAQGNGSSWNSAISADGRYVAFGSASSNLVVGDTNEAYDVFVHDRQTGQTTRVSVASDGAQGNGESGNPSISVDGRFVAFRSDSSNLVTGDTNGRMDVFVHDRQTGQTTRVSVASDGTQGNHESHTPSLSADGRYVSFVSYATNLVVGDTNSETDVFVHDRGP